jgi:hypothetical protein
MSKVDQLDNQNIINLARKQYETQQKTKVPGYIVPLPSKGLIYPITSPLRKGSIEMRHMTAYDEDILSNASYIKSGVVLEKLLESLIITPNIDIEDMILPDREALIISARIFGYGKSYPVIITDPTTNKSLERVIDLSKIPFRTFDLVSDDNGEFQYKLESNGDTIKFSFLPARFTKNINEEHSISQLLEYAIQEINGNRNKSFISEYIKYSFLASDAKKFRTYMGDNVPGLDLNLEFEGEDGSTFKSGFQLGTDLFWF